MYLLLLSVIASGYHFQPFLLLSALLSGGYCLLGFFADQKDKQIEILYLIA